MELDRLKILVDRYMEAETTLDEERELADYFATSEKVPEEYEPLRAMFRTFEGVKAQSAPQATLSVVEDGDKPKRAETGKRRWWLIGGMTTIAAAAACLIVMLTPPSATMDDIVGECSGEVAETPKMVCYIDGKMVTSESVACQEARKILGGMANDVQLAMAEVEKINFIIGR